MTSMNKSKLSIRLERWNSNLLKKLPIWILFSNKSFFLTSVNTCWKRIGSVLQVYPWVSYQCLSFIDLLTECSLIRVRCFQSGFSTTSTPLVYPWVSYQCMSFIDLLTECSLMSVRCFHSGFSPTFTPMRSYPLVGSGGNSSTYGLSVCTYLGVNNHVWCID